MTNNAPEPEEESDNLAPLVTVLSTEDDDDDHVPFSFRNSDDQANESRPKLSPTQAYGRDGQIITLQPDPESIKKK